MQSGNIVKFNKTGVLALILQVSKEGGYKSMKLHVPGDVLAHPAMRAGTVQNAKDITWMTEHMLKRTARVIK
jgi:hypothetical protein